MGEEWQKQKSNSTEEAHQQAAKQRTGPPLAPLEPIAVQQLEARVVLGFSLGAAGENEARLLCMAVKYSRTLPMCAFPL